MLITGNRTQRRSQGRCLWGWFGYGKVSSFYYIRVATLPDELYLASHKVVLFTARVQRLREGNDFSHVCSPPPPRPLAKASWNWMSSATRAPKVSWYNPLPTFDWKAFSYRPQPNVTGSIPLALMQEDFLFLLLIYYCPHTKDGEGNVFTGVCLLTGGGTLGP